MWDEWNGTVRNLFTLLNEHPVLYSDLLFHKSRNEAVRITYGYQDAPRPVRERYACALCHPPGNCVLVGGSPDTSCGGGWSWGVGWRVRRVSRV